MEGGRRKGISRAHVCGYESREKEVQARLFSAHLVSDVLVLLLLALDEPHNDADDDDGEDDGDDDTGDGAALDGGLLALGGLDGDLCVLALVLLGAGHEGHGFVGNSTIKTVRWGVFL